MNQTDMAFIRAIDYHIVMVRWQMDAEAQHCAATAWKEWIES